jgi:hypothetical protein
MADFKTAQRVRLFDGTNDFGFVVGKPLFISVSNGTIDLDLLTVNSAFGATPVGVPVVGKYESAPTTYDDGDAVPLLTDVNGKLITSTTITIGYEFVDDAAFTPATSKVAAIGMFADETAPDSVNEGDIGIPRMTLDRKQLMVIVDPTTDTQRLAITANNEAKVFVTGIKVDDAAFTPATDNVLPMGAMADEVAPDSVDEGDVGIPRMTLDRKLLVRIAGAVDSQRWAIDANGNGPIDIASQTLTAIKISKDASANSEVNPIYVQVVSQTVSGNEVHDYDMQTTTKDLTTDHDYTVAGATFFLKSVICSASGAGRYMVQVGPVASLVTVAVQFGSGANSNVVFTFDPPVEVPVASTGTVRVQRRNDDNSNMDMYSTIIGYDV